MEININKTAVLLIENGCDIKSKSPVLTFIYKRFKMYPYMNYSGSLCFLLVININKEANLCM